MSTIDVLTNVPLFAGLDARAIEALAGFTFRKTFEAGELIVEEGRTGNGLFIVVSGSAEVIKGLQTAQPRAIARLRRWRAHRRDGPPGRVATERLGPRVGDDRVPGHRSMDLSRSPHQGAEARATAAPDTGPSACRKGRAVGRIAPIPSSSSPPPFSTRPLFSRPTPVRDRASGGRRSRLPVLPTVHGRPSTPPPCASGSSLPATAGS